MSPRKIIIVLLLACFFMINPPGILLYNKPVFICGIPLFACGIMFFALMIVLLLFILYRIEFGDKKRGGK